VVASFDVETGWPLFRSSLLQVHAIPVFAFWDQDCVAAAPRRERQGEAARPRVLPWRLYFFSAAFFSAEALDPDFAIDVVGTMIWAYGVPFHITHGPPLVQSVGYASS